MHGLTRRAVVYRTAKARVPNKNDASEKTPALEHAVSAQTMNTNLSFDRRSSSDDCQTTAAAGN